LDAVASISDSHGHTANSLITVLRCCSWCWLCYGGQSFSCSTITCKWFHNFPPEKVLIWHMR